MKDGNVTGRTRGLSQFDERQDRRLPHNTFDLSHDHKTTFKMGWLTPFLTLETLPGDRFTIDHEVMCRFAPLVLPIMHRVEMSLHYFYVPNRILWPSPLGWEEFIAGNEQDLLWANVSVDNINRNSLNQYMGVPLDNFFISQPTAVNALPFAAYAKIFDEFYRNPQIQDARFKPLQAGTNNADYGTMVNQDPFKRNWNRDYFTSALPEAQFGEDILVPIVGEDNLGPRQWRKVTDGTVPSDAAVRTVGGGSESGTSGDEIYLDIQETSASMREFRLGAMLQEWMERLNRTGTRYRDFMKGFFSVDPSPQRIDDPEYIGGSKGRIVISDVLSTAQTIDSGDDITSPVGAYSGQAIALQNGNKLNYTTPEHGYIIGIINIQPRSSYFNGMPRHMQRRTHLDYAFPQFAQIGDQEILNKEVYYDWDPTNQAANDEIFGYIPRYSEYRYQNDIISGQMRDELQDFHLGRAFEDTQVLNESFIECTPRVSDVFITPTSTDHEVYCHIWNKIMVNRSLPKYGTPAL